MSLFRIPEDGQSLSDALAAVMALPLPPATFYRPCPEYTSVEINPNTEMIVSISDYEILSDPNRKRLGDFSTQQIFDELDERLLPHQIIDMLAAAVERDALTEHSYGFLRMAAYLREAHHIVIKGTLNTKEQLLDEARADAETAF